MGGPRSGISGGRSDDSFRLAADLNGRLLYTHFSLPQIPSSPLLLLQICREKDAPHVADFLDTLVLTMHDMHDISVSAEIRTVVERTQANELKLVPVIYPVRDIMWQWLLRTPTLVILYLIIVCSASM
jgi:hypothetical protein